MDNVISEREKKHNMPGNKVIVVNYVAKHGYVFPFRMVEGLPTQATVYAIVSKNMENIEDWRSVPDLNLIEIDGYTDLKSFCRKLLSFYIHDAPKIKALCKNISPAAVYVPQNTFWAAFVDFTLRKYKMTYEMHDPIPHNKYDLYNRFTNYYLGKRAERIVVLSEQFREYVSKKYKKKVSVIPSGCEIASVESSNVTPPVSFDESKINFVFQGRIDEYKGIDILVCAYKRIKSEYDNVTLTIAGSGDISPYKEKLANLTDCTVINRWIENNELPYLFNDRCVVAVLPYKSATQSGVINVAMPCGAPVIATRCGGIIEQIQDGITGLLAEPGDPDSLYNKMKLVIEHPDILSILRENAYKRMRNLDWSVLASQLICFMMEAEE